MDDGRSAGTGSPPQQVSAAIIGGGPAGLYAAECLSAQGVAVHLFDAMPSPGRKFLLAGRGGLNLTHSEPIDSFLNRYGAARDWLAPMVRACSPQGLRDWAGSLGIETFVGTSGRVFPTDFKAAPLMRAWLRRLRAQGVTLHVRHRWLGFDGGAPSGADSGPAPVLRFATPDGPRLVRAQVALLALGGGSWARLGSDGGWLAGLIAAGVDCAPLRPANCGFLCRWSEVFASRFAGTPLKTVAMRSSPHADWRRGEAVISADGIEGSLVYALSAPLRDHLEHDGAATLWIDLLPDRPAVAVQAAVSRDRGSRSWSTHLRRELGLDGVKAALLREATPPDLWRDRLAVAAAIKALPLPLTAPRPLDEAISSAGGVCRTALTEALELRAVPGVFCAGEMLDWEAPTGGYLLTGCFATARRAADGMLAALKRGAV